MKKIFGKFTFMMLAAIIAMVSMCFVSCGSDDDDDVVTSTYFIEVTNLSGGGLTESDAAALKVKFNAGFKENAAKATESGAIAAFDKTVETLKTNKELKNAITETLHMTLVLKNQQNDKVVKTASVDIEK